MYVYYTLLDLCTIVVSMSDNIGQADRQTVFYYFLLLGGVFLRSKNQPSVQDGALRV